jgi:pimeloyl-ACP methyl ester carboxylesterase
MMAARVLADAPPRFAVAGVSLGGYVAMEMVRQAPERVTRIALFGTRASMVVRPRTVVGQGLLATAPHVDPRLTSIVAGPAQAMADRVGQVVFERQQRALLARPDISEAIAAIEGSRFHLLRSCGHLSPLERPGEVTALLRQWLRYERRDV